MCLTRTLWTIEVFNKYYFEIFRCFVMFLFLWDLKHFHFEIFLLKDFFTVKAFLFETFLIWKLFILKAFVSKSFLLKNLFNVKAFVKQHEIKR